VQAAALARLKLWASVLDPDFAHSLRVAELARQLFEGLAKLGLAASSPNQDLGSILWAAALMHDVGLSKHRKAHHKISYRMIGRITPPLGWSASDLRLTAAVARFHRGALPQTRHPALQEFALDQKKLILNLSAILRFANALDAESEGQIRQLRVEQNDRRLLVSAAGYAPWTRAAENIAGSSYLLELVLRSPVVLVTLKPTRNGNASRRKPVVAAASR
jgi:exopolyphosphatase/guanosine-5'-triphosphate,3'-diphosphate pyrophosphatase